MEGILADRTIRPATVGVPKAERPAVWFSLSNDWEETANKLMGAKRRRARGLDRSAVFQ